MVKSAYTLDCCCNLGLCKAIILRNKKGLLLRREWLASSLVIARLFLLLFLFGGRLLGVNKEANVVEHLDEFSLGELLERIA